MKKKMSKNMEWAVLVCSVILVIIGLIALFSATMDSGYDEFKRQLIWFLISVPIVVTVVIVDYGLIAKISPILYGVIIALLIGVLFTSPINGATSWFNLGFFSFQPAELAKVFTIIFLSYIIVKLQRSGKDEISKVWKLALSLIIVAIPVLLIAKQPDYGTAIPFVVATVLILFVAGIKARYIISAILIAVITVPLLYIYILPPHAKNRIDVFLNPDIDPRGKGYNVIQSKLAVGSGMFLGMGITKGNQTQLGYLYPKTTDFIFAVISEEMGFVVSGSIILLYVFLVMKSISISKTAKDTLGAYIAIGIAGMFLFHMIQNIGMTMGLLPITGVPLPFVSYGGSSLITNFIAIGLLLNISGRRQKAIFVN